MDLLILKTLSLGPLRILRRIEQPPVGDGWLDTSFNANEEVPRMIRLVEDSTTITPNAAHPSEKE